MGLTIARWLGTVTIICSVLGGALIPLATPDSTTWSLLAVPPALQSEARALTEAAQALTVAVREYRTADALLRWRAARRADDASHVRIDASLPPALASAARIAVEAQWQRLGREASAGHAQVFVYFDTTELRREAGDGERRVALEPRRQFDIAYALPEATDGARCVSLVRVRTPFAADMAELAGMSLLGPCGFYARFGAPGARVRAWLSRTGYDVARRSDWDVARASATDASLIYSLSDRTARCLTGRPGACAGALALGPGADGTSPGEPGRVDAVVDGNGRGGAMGRSGVALGDAADRLLADAVRELGPERFSRFWRSDAEPEAAFDEGAGVPLSEWTRRWLEREYGAIRQSPTVGARDVLWLVVGLPLLALAAGWRRETVLSERWRQQRA